MVKLNHGWVVELDQSHTVHSAEDDTHSKALSVAKEPLRNSEEVSHHHLGFVILVLVEPSGLLRAKEIVVDTPQKAEPLTDPSGHQSPRPGLLSEGALCRSIGVD